MMTGALFKRAWSRSVVIVVALIGSGCLSVPRFHPPGEGLAVSDANAVCVELAGKGTPLDSLRALVEAHIMADASSSGSLRYGIVVKEPSSARVDVLPLEGAYTLGLLVITKDGATLIDTNEKTFSQDPDSGQLTRKLFGIQGLSPQVITALVTRRLPRMSCDGMEAFVVDGQTSLLLDRRQHIAWRVNKETGVVTEVWLLDEENEKIEVMAGLTEVNGAAEANLSMYSPTTAAARLVARKVVVNPVVPDSYFQVAIPPGYRRVD